MAAMNWRDRVQQLHPAAHAHMVGYIGTLTSDPAIPEVYRELIILASSTAVRYRTSMETHARRALAAGATQEQVFLTMALAGLSSGFTTMIEAAEVMAALEAGPPAPAP